MKAVLARCEGQSGQGEWERGACAACGGARCDAGACSDAAAGGAIPRQQSRVLQRAGCAPVHHGRPVCAAIRPSVVPFAASRLASFWRCVCVDAFIRLFIKLFITGFPFCICARSSAPKTMTESRIACPPAAAAKRRRGWASSRANTHVSQAALHSDRRPHIMGTDGGGRRRRRNGARSVEAAACLRAQSSSRASTAPAATHALVNI